MEYFLYDIGLYDVCILDNSFDESFSYGYVMTTILCKKCFWYSS